MGSDLPNFCKLNVVAIDTKRKRSETPVCAICTEPMMGGTVTLVTCGHRFHRRCIKRWVKNNAGNTTCPLCRIEIDHEQLNDLRDIVTSDQIVPNYTGGLEVEYGRGISEALLGSGSGDSGYARGNLFLVQNPRAQMALKYLVLGHYMRERFFEDYDQIDYRVNPLTMEYAQVIISVQAVFDVNDWSKALIGDDDDLRPPFEIVSQTLDDGIQYEHLRISEDALVHWLDENESRVVSWLVSAIGDMIDDGDLIL